jgi:hypothetical protein
LEELFLGSINTNKLLRDGKTLWSILDELLVLEAPASPDLCLLFLWLTWMACFFRSSMALAISWRALTLSSELWNFSMNPSGLVDWSATRRAVVEQLLHPGLVLQVQNLCFVHRFEKSIHGYDLQSEGFDLGVYASEALVVVAERSTQLPQNGLHGPRRRTHQSRRHFSCFG